MEAQALQRNVKISARKAGLVCDMVRGKTIREALSLLETTDKKIAPIMLKLLKSAIANATNNHAMNAETLYVKQFVANQGPSAKRSLPRAKGDTDTIKKRTTHLHIILADRK